jgi:hypothetical protein
MRQSSSVAEPKLYYSAPAPTPAPRTRKSELRLRLQARIRINFLSYLDNYFFDLSTSTFFNWMHMVPK